MSEWLMAYLIGFMPCLAWKAYHDAKADRATGVWEALGAAALWPVVWPIMLGQVAGAAKRRKDG